MNATCRVALALMVVLAWLSDRAGAEELPGMVRQARCLLPSVQQALSGPAKPQVYIDTDTANEVDDPFAFFRALVAPEIEVVGLSSMSWAHHPDFAAGTRQSQKMNEDVLALLNLTDRVSHPLGALKPMPDANTPVDSPAASDIIARAKAMPDGQKLQVFVLGAYTNVASALLLDPSIKDKLSIHVMGYNYHDDGRLTTDEFNCQGDLNAAAYLPRSGVELYVMPASILWGFLWTKADADAHFKGRGGVPDYLIQRWEAHAPDDPRRILWDIAVFEAFLRPDLATLAEVVIDGSPIHVWTHVNTKGMQTDYWEATQARPRVYIDTDMAAEVDDSFAVFRALVAPELDIVGLSAMGWEGPLDFATNTRQSQKMISDVLTLMKLDDRISHPIGALHPMPDANTPVDSPAASDIIAKAKETPDGQKLQVFVLGAYTNIASALLLDPSIKDKVSIHVMGYRFDDETLTINESNSNGDRHAAAYLLKSGAELYVMPNSTLRHFQWNKADAANRFQGRGGVHDYLIQRWKSYAPNDPERTLWDIAVFEAFLRPELATLAEINHGGFPIHIWTAVDIPAMKADYWKATQSE